MRSELKINLILFLGLLSLFIAVTAGTLDFPLTAVLTFILVMGLYLALADRRFVLGLESFQQRGPAQRLALPLFLFLLLTLYSLPVSGPAFLSSGLLLAYLLIPLWMAEWDGRVNRERIRLTLPMAAAVLICWLPLEFGFLEDIRLPRGRGIPLIFPVAVIAAFYTFRVVRGLEGIGLTYRLQRSDWKVSLFQAAFYMSFFAIPLGVSLDFAQSAVPSGAPWSWIPRAGVIFFFTALPEELLFRGIIHNLLERTLSSRFTALAVSSLVFGLAHVNNPETPLWTLRLGSGFEFEIPWVYLILATIAGFFYGWVYIRTGKITASAVVHTLVNTWWSVFFSAGS